MAVGGDDDFRRLAVRHLGNLSVEEGTRWGSILGDNTFEGRTFPVTGPEMTSVLVFQVHRIVVEPERLSSVLSQQ